jgi:flavin-dependent dehydrogenase
MTPKEKAKELVDKYYIFNHIGNRHAVKCALIAVDEIKEQLIQNLSNDVSAIHAIYWEKVKQEIEKL